MSRGGFQVFGPVPVARLYHLAFVVAAVCYDMAAGGPDVADEFVVAGEDPGIEKRIAGQIGERQIVRIERGEVGPLPRRDATTG